VLGNADTKHDALNNRRSVTARSYRNCRQNTHTSWSSVGEDNAEGISVG